MIIITIILAICLKASIGLSIPFGKKISTTIQIKDDLLNLSRKVNRGLSETPEERAKINDLFSQLEQRNPNKKSLKCEQVNGIWTLEYTTSDSILGRKGFRKVGDIYQKIDAINLKAENSEVVEYFFLKVPQKVTADLTPMSDSKVAVQFKVFSIGPFSFNAPESFKGELEVTYVDKNMRLSRGDKGNIFILSKKV
jgi:hypothetical protein